jgi:hypothetical protein
MGIILSDIDRVDHITKDDFVNNYLKPRKHHPQSHRKMARFAKMDL